MFLSKQNKWILHNNHNTSNTQINNVTINEKTHIFPDIKHNDKAFEMHNIDKKHLNINYIMSFTMSDKKIIVNIQ